MMLWAFVVQQAEIKDDKEVAGAVLLVVPAVLVAFVVRLGEHALATRLLSGVRMLVLLSGTCSVLGAASLAGIRPNDWGLDHAFKVVATIATVVAATISFAWLQALDFMATRRAENQPHRRSEVWVRMVLMQFLASLFLVYGAIWTGRVMEMEGLAAIGLLAIALFALYAVSLAGTVSAPNSLGWAAAATWITIALVLLGAVALAGVTPWTTGVQESWSVYGTSAVVLLGMALLVEAIGYLALRRRDAQR
jgi:hypothetical protein